MTRNQSSDAYQRLHHLVDAIPNPLWSITPTGIITFVNGAVTRFTGYSQAELLGQNWWQLLQPDLQPEGPEPLLKPQLQSHQADPTASPSQPLRLTLWLTTKQGDRRELTWHAIPRWDSAGNLVEIMGLGIEGSTPLPAPGGIKAEVAAEITTAGSAALDRHPATPADLSLRLQQERLIQRSTQRIRQSLDLDEVLHTTVTEVREFLHTDRVIIYQFNDQGAGRVVVEAVASPWLSLLDREIYDPCFSQDYLPLYRAGRSRHIDNIQIANIQPCHRNLLTSFQVQANLVVPILKKTQLWGLLIAHHCQAVRHWQAAEVDLLQQLGDQVGIAIHQAELFRQIQDLNADLEAQVQRRTLQLRRTLAYESILRRITDSVRSSLDEEQILNVVVQELGLALQVEYCATGAYNATRTTVTITHEYAGSLPSVHHQTLVFSAETSIHQELLQGRTVQACNIGTETLHDFQESHTILACPIMDDQSVLGDLWLIRPPEQCFSTEEVGLVQHLTHHCAIALRQAQLYKAAQRQVQELERLNQLKDDFLSTVSHELRTPMSSIQMSTEMLEMRLHRLDLDEATAQNIFQYLEVLHSECAREMHLINDLLDLSRLDAGTEPLRPTTIILQYWIPHILEPYLARTTYQHQTLDIQIPDDLPPIHTDLKYLERSLNELVNNATKYTPAGSAINVSARLSAQGITIVVQNFGIEISPDEYNRVFDKFYRIPNEDPWKHGGTGLGLALVRRMIHYIGGEVWVKSGNNRTEFGLDLPLVFPAIAPDPTS